MFGPCIINPERCQATHHRDIGKLNELGTALCASLITSGETQVIYPLKPSLLSPPKAKKAQETAAKPEDAEGPEDFYFLGQDERPAP
jgi:hypothetical protein